MNSYKTILSHLELEARTQLKVFAIQQEYKTLLSSVSHDLTTPLAYLKFSSNILESQVKSNYNDELKETARVIASSTQKLSDESKTIVENAKAKLKSFNSKETDIKEIVSSALECLEIETIDIEVEDQVLVTLDSVYTYLLALLIHKIKTFEYQLSKIRANGNQNDLLIYIYIKNLSPETVEKEKTSLIKNIDLDDFKNSFSLLNTKLEFSHENNSIVVSVAKI